MGKAKDSGHPLDQTRSTRRRSGKARESQLTALAYDLVEQRLRDGTATSQETTHFLRLGSEREKRETMLAEMQLKLMQAKIDKLESDRRIEELYKDALGALQTYRSGNLAEQQGDAID